MSVERPVWDGTITLVEGDICDQEVDAIVNAANSGLRGGGGVDGAIHRRGGPTIMAETREKFPAGCPTGSAVLTAAGDLTAKHVVHAVGPVWHGGDQQERAYLLAAYSKSLDLAAEHGCQSIAFPALSAGAYGYPLEEAAEVGLQAAIAFLRDRKELPDIRFVLFGTDAYQAFAETLDRLAPAAD